MDVRAQVIEPTGADWQALMPAIGTPAVLAEMQQRHQMGAAVMLNVTGDANGRALLWVEIRQIGGRELVIGQGVGTGARAFIRWLIGFARANNLQSIRTHCQRAGLIRLYQWAGFRVIGTDDNDYSILRWADGRQQQE